MSSEKHQEQRDQAQKIISSLAQREQELEKGAEEAKAEAERVLEKAKAEASSVLEAARTRIEQESTAHRKAVAQKTLQLIEQRKKTAAGQAAELEKQAQARQGKAVDLVIEQVFPGS